MAVCAVWGSCLPGPYSTMQHAVSRDLNFALSDVRCLLFHFSTLLSFLIHVSAEIAPEGGTVQFLWFVCSVQSFPQFIFWAERPILKGRWIKTSSYADKNPGVWGVL